MARLTLDKPPRRRRLPELLRRAAQEALRGDEVEIEDPTYRGILAPDRTTPGPKVVNRSHRANRDEDPDDSL